MSPPGSTRRSIIDPRRWFTDRWFTDRWFTNRWSADRRGAVAVLGALSMTSLVGMAGFAVDFGAAYVQRARLQKVADSAAMAGAISWVKTGSTTAVIATIKDVVVANGWSSSIIQSPNSAYLATSPKNASDAAIQVSLSATSTLTLTKVLSDDTSLTTTAYAAVQIGTSTIPVCLLSLTTLMVNGSIHVPSCTVEANSAGNPAITVNGGGSITAANVETPGAITDDGTITATIKTGATAAANPYSGYASEASSGFTNCQNYNNQTTLSAGCWSNVNIGSAVTLNPGAYFFTNININSGGSITGTGGVTLVTEQQFSPSGNLTITAPTSGSWAGMAIYALNGMNINSNVTFKINGALYSPNATLIPDSGTWNQNACTYIVAQSITFNGGSSFTLPQSGCGNYGFPAPSTAGGTGAIAMAK